MKASWDDSSKSESRSEDEEATHIFVSCLIVTRMIG